MILIGLAGRKHSGKDTVHQAIKALHPTLKVARVAFGDPLKQEVASTLGITVADIENEKPRFRLILQWWGTEWRRHSNPSYWIDIAREHIIKALANNDITVVTDVRFINEANLIRSLGGRVIQVLRHRTTHTDQHPSETNLDSYHFDDFVHNYGDINNLQREVANILPHHLLHEMPTR